MPDKVLVWCTPLEYHRTLQLLVGHILKMSWQKKPHGHCTVSHTMCILLLTLRGDLHPPQENILRSKDPKPAIILLHIHPNMKWRLQHRNFLNCANQKLINSRVDTQPQQIWSFSHGWKISKCMWKTRTWLKGMPFNWSRILQPKEPAMK